MRRAHGEPLHLGVNRIELRRSIDTPAFGKTPQHRERDVLPDPELRNNAMTLAILGHHRDAGRDRVRWRANADGLAFHDDLRGTLARIRAEDSLHEFRAPRPDEPRNAEDFAFSQRERHVVDTLAVGIGDVEAGDVARLED